MKNIIYIIGCLVVLLANMPASASAQQLYRFAFEQDNSQRLTVRQEGLNMEPALTAENELIQLFIIRRTTENVVYIASASNPELFLKRSGNTAVLGTYQANDNTYHWTVIYSGYPFASLVDPNTDRVLSWQGGFSMIDVPAALSNNNDASGNHYRLRLETVSDTF